jgi:protoporphyrinogen oxidase
VGHLERLESLEESISEFSGLFCAGKGYKGVGVADCVASADITSEKICEFLDSSSI